MWRFLTLLTATGCRAVFGLEPPSHVDDGGSTTDGPRPNDGQASDSASATDASGNDAMMHTIPSGAVLWLKMDDDPTDGALDSAGSHSATCVANACPMLVAGRIGSAYKFTAEQIRIASSNDLQPNTAFTLAAWVRLAAMPSDAFATIACKTFGTANDDTYCLSFRNTAGILFYTYGATYLDGAVIPLSEWHHFALTWDGTTKRGYVDGNEVGTQTDTSITSDTMPFAIGSDNTTPQYFLNGAIDDLVFYGRRLSASEVGQLANP